MGIIDRIKYDGNPNGAQWLIHKCPSEQFVLGSQLIVNQGQEALFLRGGEALDLFTPGTHTLSTGNLPILNRLVNLPFGGKTPFAAEIYYINKTANLDLKWGTSTPVPLEDPKYGIIVNIGARGQYGITIRDSRLFVSRIIGAVPNGATANHLLILNYFNGLINATVKSIISKYMIRKQISFLEISQFLSELSDEFQKALYDEFERFGIEVVNFYCESIAPKPGEYDALRKHKEKSLEQVICPRCGAMNGRTTKFCGSCGNELICDAICPYCGVHVPTGMKFCGKCGKPLSSIIICASCGFKNRVDMEYCGNCGQKM